MHGHTLIQEVLNHTLRVIFKAIALEILTVPKARLVITFFNFHFQLLTCFMV